MEFLKTLEDGTRLVPDLEKLERVEEFKVCGSSHLPHFKPSLIHSVWSAYLNNMVPCFWGIYHVFLYACYNNTMFFGHYGCSASLTGIYDKIYPTLTMRPDVFLSKSLSSYRKSSFLWAARSCITPTASRSTALSVPATPKCPKCWSKVHKSRLKGDLAACQLWDFHTRGSVNLM